MNHKVVILHASETGNYGTFMMLINFISYLSKLSNISISFFVDLNKKKDFLRLKNEIKKNIYISPFSLSLISSSKNKIIKLKKRLYSEVSFLLKLNSSIIAVLGGDNLSEYNSNIVTILELLKIYRTSKKVKVYLVGQTIGPFSSYRKLIAKKVLKNCKIYTRDSLCSEYLRKELQIKNIFESSDLAFLDLPLQKEKVYSLEKYNLKKDEYISIVPSGLINSYTPNKEDYLICWLKIIRDLLSNPKIKNKKLVLIPHVLKPDRVDDRIVINFIQNKLKDKEKKRILFFNEEMLPSEARFILGNSLFTITGRMHAAISTFQMGKPAISLSYSVKYKGIIGKDLERSDLIIESANEKLWRSGEIVQQLNNKIDYLLTNYPKLQKEIKRRIKFLKEKALSQIKDISLKLKNER
jgi:colanic acid/amylovoran biosynthesis protein